MTVVYTEAPTLALRFWMHKLVDQLNCLSEIATNASYELEEIVIVKGGVVVQPKGNVFVADRELTVRLEFRDFTRSKLADEPRVTAPEETNIINFEEFHCPTFESKAKRPAYLLSWISLSILKNAIENDTTAKNLQPFSVIKYFQLDRGVCEWKEIRVPTHFHIAEYVPG